MNEEQKEEEEDVIYTKDKGVVDISGSEEKSTGAVGRDPLTRAVPLNWILRKTCNILNR